MNMKMNTDFLKNITIPPIQLPKVPKLKTRKIFSTTSTSSTTDIATSSGPSIAPVTATYDTRTVRQYDTIEINRDLSKPKPLVSPPAKISTISQLVDGAPTYDYSFGNASIPDHLIERIIEEDEKQIQQQSQQSQQQSQSQTDSKSKSCTPGNLSKRFNKHYKELSEFKIKDIFSKKIVVKTTEIDPNVYMPSEKSDMRVAGIPESRYSFPKRLDSIDDADDNEIQVIEPIQYSNESKKTGGFRSQSLYKRRKFGSIKQLSVESSSSGHFPFSKATSLQVLNGIKPNESSLWKMKKTKSKSSSSVENVSEEKNSEKVTEKVNEKRNRFSKRSLSRQDIDAAFDKAKKSVNSKFRQLKMLQSRATGSKDSDKTSKKSTKMISGPIIEIIDRRGSFDSFDSEKQLPEVDLAVLKEEWIAGKLLSCDEIPRCLLYPEDLEETTVAQVCIVTRLAPPIPTPEFESRIEEITDDDDLPYECPTSHITQKVIEIDVPKRKTPSPISPSQSGQVIVALYHHASTSSPPMKNDKFSDFGKGHSRKISMDSTDSDSWIPEKLRGMTRGQISLNKIEETSGAWKVNNNNNVDDSSYQRVIKVESVDIFKQEGEEAFEDFDTVLQNVPVIMIDKDDISESSLDDKLHNQRSIEFSTTDDEDEIEPDILSVVELPQATLTTDEKKHEVYEEIQNNEVFEEIQDNEVFEEIQNNEIFEEIQNNEISENPIYDEQICTDIIHSKQEISDTINMTSIPISDIKLTQEINQIEISDFKNSKIFYGMKRSEGILDLPQIPIVEVNLPKIETNISSKQSLPEDIKIKTQSSVDQTDNEDTFEPVILTDYKQQTKSKYDENQNSSNFNRTFVKQLSMRRKYSDGLETEQLTDVSVNKLISRFEFKKSSNSLETPKHNKITVEAIIESSGYRVDSPENIMNNINTINNNQNLQKRSSTESTDSKFESLNYVEPKIKSLDIENNNNNGNENENGNENKKENENENEKEKENENKNENENENEKENENGNDNNLNKNNFNDSRRRSTQWAISSKSINKTIDLSPDKNEIEIFYSFEDDEDLRRIGNNNAYNTTTMATKSSKTVRHVYNAVL